MGTGCQLVRAGGRAEWEGVADKPWNEVIVRINEDRWDEGLRSV